MDGATTTVVGIIGNEPLVSRTLGLLLEGAGYEARPLDEAAVLEDPSASLAGVDLVLFLPLLGDVGKGELVGVVKGAPTTADVPVISLSTELKAELDERTDSVLPWPWSTQALMRAIERAVHAPDGEPARRRTVVGSVVRERRPSPASWLLLDLFDGRQQHPERRSSHLLPIRKTSSPLQALQRLQRLLKVGFEPRQVPVLVCPWQQ